MVGCVCCRSYKSEYASSYLEPWKLFSRPTVSAAWRPYADGTDSAPDDTAERNRPHSDDKSQVLRKEFFLISFVLFCIFSFVDFVYVLTAH